MGRLPLSLRWCWVPLLAAVGCATTPELVPGPPPAPRFARQPPRPGDAYLQDFSLRTAMTLRVPRAEGQEDEVRAELTEVKRFTQTVLAVEGEVVTKARIHYLLWETTERSDGVVAAQTVPVVLGRRYIVELTPIGVRVLGDDERDVLAVERDTVSADVRGLVGGLDPVVRALDGVELRLGEPVPSLRAALAEVVKGEIASIDVRLADLRDTEAEYAVRLQQQRDTGSVSLAVSTAGTLTVQRPTGRLTRLVLDGPMQLASSHAGTHGLAGDGTFRLLLTRTPLPK